MSQSDAAPQESTECPTCGQSFDSVGGMKSHHTQSHGKSIAGVETKCDWCGDVYRVKRSHKERRKYCSKECESEKHSQTTGSDHPLWDRVELECPVCENTFYCKSSHASKRKHCSNACYSKAKKKTFGQDHPLSKPGYSDYYGENWADQREKARKRDDYECQICGSEDIHVHHIRPFRTFGLENYKEANRLENLICLCPTHHREWEGIPLRPQTDGIPEGI